MSPPPPAGTRRFSILPSPRASQPAFPSSLHTHSPTPSYNREPKSLEEKDNRATSNPEFSSPKRGDGAPEVGDRIGAGRGSRRGWGSLTAVRPGRRLPASHHGPKGKGEKGQGASGMGMGFRLAAAYSEPTRAESRTRTAPVPPRARPSSPALLQRVGGGAGPRGGAKVSKVSIGGRGQAGT